MKLMSALNGFLQNFYTYFAPPSGPGNPVEPHVFYESILVRAVQSAEFRRRLLENPEAVLAEAGIMLPEGMTVSFIENTSDTVHIVIPPFVGE